ncbi:hypothetical protein [Neptunicoccus cionae]|uniref:hypothetical protein n=1 Tax=Neptunicoccus cionae TaxID=2035344 RepID=UPI0015E07E9C|nr:hypothetical protein [Amylibacter cionae]
MTTKYTLAGDRFQNNTFSTGIQKYPESATLEDGSLVVTWMSPDQDGDSNGIFAQRYSSSAQPQGAEFQVNTFTDGSQEKPAIVGLSDGGFVIAWASAPLETQPELGQDGSGSGIYAQVFDAEGFAVGSEFLVNTVTRSNQGTPSLTAISDGGFMVNWSSRPLDGEEKEDSLYGAYGRVFEADGTATGPEFNFNEVPQYPPSNVASTELESGGFVAVWKANRKLQGRILDEDGTPNGEIFRIDTDDGRINLDPEVVALEGGGFAVSWSTNYYKYREYTSVQVFDETGQKVGMEYNPKSHFHHSDSGYASIASLSDGGFVLVRHEGGASRKAIFAETFSAEGKPLGDEIVVARDVSTLGLLSVVGAENKGFVVSWSDPNGYTPNSNVFSQRVSYNTEPDGKVKVAGVVQVGQIVTADLSKFSDADGIIEDTISYQWFRNGTVLVGETDDNYAFTPDDLGKKFRVYISYTDENGVHEMVKSKLSESVRGIGENIFGTAGHDSLKGGQGQDLLVGKGGNDTLSGGTKGDIIQGNLGDDSIFGGGGRDLIYGGSGGDQIYGGSSNDKLRGGEGHDYIWGVSGNDKLFGNLGADSLYGGFGEDVIRGGSGDDEIFGGDGNDKVYGNPGDDRIFGGAGEDVIRGGSGNDEIWGDGGNDKIFGNLGDNTIFGGEGNDNLLGDDGNDVISGDSGNDSIFGGKGNDTLSGGVGNDSIIGSDGHDVLQGGDGLDEISGGKGNDEIYGDGDRDSLSGMNGNDTLFGGDGADLLLGGEGDDTLHGGSGDDELKGELGNNILTGGDGSDTFWFSDGNDTITDFDALDENESINLSSAYGIVSFNDLILGGHTEQVGDDVLITDDRGDSIRMLSVQMTDLDPTDFIF